LLYKNLRNGRFDDVSTQAGPGITVPVASRGCAFGDFDNDGDIDMVVNTVNDFPQLLRCDSSSGPNGIGHNWLKVRTIGTKSNRSGIGARLRCVTQPADETKLHQQIDEVRSGGSYISQNDLRVHFGLGKAEKVDVLEIRWPSGQIDTLKDVKPNQLVYVKEGEGIVRSVPFGKVKGTRTTGS
jgi:enediyne biosynthesis protein E4